MNKNLKRAAAFLVAYSLLAGMLVPLNTGILGVSPRTAKGGAELQMTIKGYNADFDGDVENYEARIRLNPDKAICAKKIVSSNPQELTLSFDVPTGKLPIQNKLADGNKSPFPLLEINSKNNGYSSLESAIYLEENLTNGALTQALCDIKNYAKVDKTTFPFLNILEETIRNLFFHVPMWFGMMFLLFLSVIHSILYLLNPQLTGHDIKASSLATVGVLFGLAGIFTGALWAKNTWGAYWSFDVKQNTSAVALLIYLAYFVLRSSFDDIDKRARIAAIYNIFAFATLVPLLYIIPRMVDSLHPGMGGNPAFSKLDLDNTMRMIFYPAVIGWVLMGLWMADLSTRIEKLTQYKLEQDDL